MLTRNFYKLATVQQYGTYIRNDTSGGTAPYIDIINANGKIICKKSVSGDDRYEGGILYSNDMGGYSNYGSYRIASLPSGNGQANQRFSVINSGRQRTLSFYDNAFDDRDNDINSNTSSSYCSMGAPTMYIGNGTTVPTKDDYTMESCLTAYTIKGCNIIHKLNDGIIIISFSILPTEDLQLSEIGIFTDEMRPDGINRNATPKSILAMVCHDVFTPVTLPQGKLVTINYTINLSELTAETTIG